MKRILVLMLMLSSMILISGCTQYIQPKNTPVEAKLKAEVKCGKIVAKRKNGKTTLANADYLCLRTKLKRCQYDRKVLLIAHKANMEQMQ